LITNTKKVKQKNRRKLKTLIDAFGTPQDVSSKTSRLKKLRNLSYVKHSYSLNNLNDKIVTMHNSSSCSQIIDCLLIILESAY